MQANKTYDQLRGITLPLRLLFYTVFACLAGSICYHYGLHFYIDSDEANYYLAAQDMAHGNFLLKDWVFSPDNFWLIDIVGMAALIKYWGLGLTTPHLMAALWWGGVTFLALCLSNPPSKQWSWVRCLPVVLFIAFPPLYEHRPSGFITFIPYHIGTLFYALCGLFSAQMLYVRKNVFVSYLLIIFTAFLIFTSDFFGVVVYIIPLMLSALMFYFKGDKNIPLKGLFLSFGSALFGSEILKFYVHHHDGFIARELHSKFVALEDIPEKTVYIVKSFVDFFGVNFWGHSFGNAIPNFIKLFPFLFLCAYFYGAYKKVKIQKGITFPNCDYITLTLIVGASIDFSAACLSDFSLYKEDIIRYFLPFFLYMVLIYTRMAKFKKHIFLVPTILLCGVYLFSWNISKNSTKKDIFGINHQIETSKIENVLRRNNVHLGYAGYWEASVLTANSHGQIISKAISINSKADTVADMHEPTCRLMPYVWISKAQWYRKSIFENEKTIFFITHLSGQVHDNWLLQNDVVASLGQPDKVIFLGENMAINIYSAERVFACQSLFIE